MSDLKVLVVLPTFNERQTVEEVLRGARIALPEATFLVVDDSSPDGTADLVARLGVESGNIALLRRASRGGLGSAYRAGFAWGLAKGYDVLLQMDADMSHDPMALPALIQGLSRGDLVIGSRYVPGAAVPEWNWRRRLLSVAGNRYAARMLSTPIHDMTAGFRAYRAELLRSIRLDGLQADGYAFQVEMTYRAARLGARIVEIPISFRERMAGQSKMSLKIILEAFWLVSKVGIAERLSRTHQPRFV